MHSFAATAPFSLKALIHCLVMAGVSSTLSLAQAQEEAAATLPTVTVVGSADKSGDNFKSSAQSVSIITEQDIKDRGPIRRLDDLLFYEAGVLGQQYGSDNKSTWLRIRGFNTNVTLDGTAVSNNSFFVLEQESYGLEKVEVLKGANSFNYGSTDAGGTVNLVSKRPKKTAEGELNVSVGNFSRRSVSGDYSGLINEDLRYRLVGLYSKGNFPQDHTGMEQYYFAPSITWDISDRTSLTVLASVLKRQGLPTTGFMPAYGSLINTPFGKIGYDTYLGEPGRDYLQRRQYSLGYEFSHDFGDQLKFTQNYRYGKIDHNFLTTFAYGMVTGSDRLGARGYSFMDGDSSVHSVDNRLSKTFTFGDFENTLLVGYDYKRNHADAQHRAFGFPVADIDIFNPEYDGNFDVTGVPYVIRLKQHGLYALNKLNWNDLVLFNLGLRRDNFDSAANVNGTISDDKGDKNTHNASLMFNLPLGFSPYVSHSTSFNPQVGADNRGRAYVPLSGKQLEVGLKYNPDWLKGSSFNLALFDLKENNALVPDALFVQTQVGERRNRGIELQSDVRINDNLSARLSLTRNHATQDYTTERSGRALLIPDHQAAVKLNYRHTQGALNGLRLSLGVRYNGSTEDKANNSGYTVPSYTLVDAMAIYPLSEHWSLQVNATNLLNKEYLSVCESACFYGTSRTVDAQLSYYW